MPSALRPVLVVVFLIGIAISIGDVIAPAPQLSAFGFDLSPVVGRQDVYRVDALRGLAVRGGIVHPGDELRLLDPSPMRRISVVAPGAPVRYLDLRNGASVTLTDTLPRAFDPKLWKLLRVAIEITALVLLLMRGTMPVVVGLATFLFMSLFTYPAMSGAFLGSWWQAAYTALGSALVAVGRIGLVVLAAGFSPTSRTRRVAVRVLVALSLGWIAWTVAAAAIGILAGQTAYIGRVDSVAELILSTGALALFARGILRTSGTERRRVVVLALAVVIGSSTDLYTLFGPSLYNDTQAFIGLVAHLVMTVGLAYAILVDRMFDIGFVINRAVAFAAASVIVIALFILIESVIGKQAEKLGSQGTTIGMALAVVIGLSLRPLHKRVDDFVDHVFFAVRHRNANAIRRFGAECDDIETRERLLERTVETVRRFGRVDGCAIVLADEHGNLCESNAADFHVRPLERDSLVTLRLRSSRLPLERGAGSPLDVADAAFPIRGRNRLAGALLCKLPTHAEPYSPEEFQALERLAHHIASALLAIDAADAAGLREENAALRERARRSAHR